MSKEDELCDASLFTVTCSLVILEPITLVVMVRRGKSMTRLCFKVKINQLNFNQLENVFF